MATLDDQGSLQANPSGPALEGPTPLLFDGQRLDQPAFHERYHRMPDHFRAELIEGVVHVNMPLYEDHGRPDADIIGWLHAYKIETPGTIVQSNTTAILGPRSEVQPDSALRIHPDHGGRTRNDDQGAMIGCPELVVEVASSSLQIDLNEKKRIYEEAGALEYLVFDVVHQRFHWFAHLDGRFEPLQPDLEGLYKSRAFPGLWLDAAAFLRDDGQAVMAALRRGLADPEHGRFVERLRQYRANRT